MGTYHIIFLSFTFLAATPVLIYYYKRNPNPRFRPSFGEMTLVTLLALGVCFGIAWPTANLLESPEDIKFQGPTGPSELDDSGARRAETIRQAREIERSQGGR